MSAPCVAGVENECACALSDTACHLADLSTASALCRLVWHQTAKQSSVQVLEEMSPSVLLLLSRRLPLSHDIIGIQLCCKVMQQCTAVAPSPSTPDSTDHASACCQEEQKQQGKCAEAGALRALSKTVNRDNGGLFCAKYVTPLSICAWSAHGELKGRFGCSDGPCGHYAR